MLVITIKDGSPVYIGDNIIIRTFRRSNQTKIVIEAPKEVVVLRDKHKAKIE